MTFRGGARIGRFNATWPFATLSLGADSVSLTVFGDCHVLKKEEVARLELFRGWFSSGVKITHSSDALDQHAVFWSFSPEKVLEAAAKLGFSTKEADA